MTQNWPKRVTYNGRRAEEWSPTRTNGAPARLGTGGARGELGFKRNKGVR